MQKQALGIYIHWPFCLSKCPYCDFNSHVRQNIDTDAFKSALLHDIRYAAAQIAIIRPVDSVFFGGGTPSLMPPALVAACLDEIEHVFGYQPHAEITLEANPTSVEQNNFLALRAAGINRLSLGIQALSQPALQALGRTYSVQEALNAAELARRVFARVSFDLIYARHHVRNEDLNHTWAQELQHILQLADDHISLYQLTIEEGTRFFDWYHAGKLCMPTDDAAADYFLYTNAQLTQHGFTQYETSNYSRWDGESRHNLIYWRYQEYLGIGAGACSRFYRCDGAWVAQQNIKQPEQWCRAVLNQPAHARETDVLSNRQQATELLLMSARLQEGINKKHFAQLHGAPLVLDSQWQTHDWFIDTPTHIRFTTKGRMVSDRLIHDLNAQMLKNEAT